MIPFVSELVLDTLKELSGLSGELVFLASGDEKPSPCFQVGIDSKESEARDAVSLSNVRQETVGRQSGWMYNLPLP